MTVNFTWNRLFAALAAIVFAVAVFGGHIAGLELVPLGLLFVALAMLV